jgi:hypothetical protein
MKKQNKSYCGVLFGTLAAFGLLCVGINYAAIPHVYIDYSTKECVNVVTEDNRLDCTAFTKELRNSGQAGDYVPHWVGPEPSNFRGQNLWEQARHNK